jgi:hypothetical protein
MTTCSAAVIHELVTQKCCACSLRTCLCKASTIARCSCRIHKHCSCTLTLMADATATSILNQWPTPGERHQHHEKLLTGVKIKYLEIVVITSEERRVLRIQRHFPFHHVIALASDHFKVRR